jgi:molybdopterin-binding protein
MRMSARNQLKGKIVGVEHGVTTSHVKIDVGGTVITASITKTSADELQLAVGREATAIIKASDVMVGVD